MTILGRDCNGKPLRAGDLCIVIKVVDDSISALGTSVIVARECHCLVCTIYGAGVVVRSPIATEIAAARNKPQCCAITCGLQKLTPDEGQFTEERKEVSA